MKNSLRLLTNVFIMLLLSGGCGFQGLSDSDNISIDSSTPALMMETATYPPPLPTERNNFNDPTATPALSEVSGLLVFDTITPPQWGISNSY